MKQTQNNPAYAVDDFEDLTRFANESFDTGDIDLFAFAGNEEQSPLTRLKSIILSLDWEITDETLQELADEIKRLVEEWKGDKVAQVYLQGLNKVGAYIQERGAYAHHNAIKLLLTFFYDFEKIVVSDNLSQDDATRILKGDVRKFRILQYQIAQHEAAAAAAEGRGDDEYGGAEESALTRQLQIAVLAIDWEVTKETIGALREALAKLKQVIPDNRNAMILIQGLNGLAEYVAEEKADAHPEAFVLLHNFSTALEQIADPDQSDLDQLAIKELLQDRVARLLELKMMIAGYTPPAPEAEESLTAPLREGERVAINSDTELPSSLEVRSGDEKERSLTKEDKGKNLDDLEMEIDSFFEMEGKVPAVAAVSGDDDDNDYMPLHSSFGEIIPALADTEGPARRPAKPASNQAERPGQLLDGLADGIDDFFNDIEEEDSSLNKGFALPFDSNDSDDSLLGSTQVAAMESANSRYPDEVLPPEAIHPVDDELADDFIESSLSSKRGLQPALSGTTDTTGFHEEEAQVDPDMQSDLTEQLDTFFANAGSEKSEEETLTLEEDTLMLDTLSKPSAPFPGAINVSPADEEDPDLMAINTQLDSFFGLNDKEPGKTGTPIVEAALSTVENEPIAFIAELSDGEKEEANLEDELSERLEVLFDDSAFSDTLAEQATEEEQEFAADEVKAVAEELEIVQQEQLEVLFDDSAFSDTLAAQATEEEQEFAADEVKAVAEELEIVQQEQLEVLFDDSAFSDTLAAQATEKEQEVAAEEARAVAEELEIVQQEQLEVLFDDSVFSDTLAEQATEEEQEVAAEEVKAVAEELEIVQQEQLQVEAQSATSAEQEQELDDFFDFELDNEAELEVEEDQHVSAHQMQLNTLGALLPGVVQVPTPEKADTLMQAIQDLQAQGLRSDQQAIAQLLSATVTMLTSSQHWHTPDLLVNHLYTALRSKDAEPEALPTAIGHFTAWIAESCTVVPSAENVQEEEKRAAEEEFQPSGEISQELVALRNFIKNEFDKLRQEMS